ncbi:hypothetical protein BWZ20_02875 [Winogradskyella sp. J14-2]|uniref:hypothetical protein n=1 Tax=Winogradskyella sp. J14-2 TaxID=1936080 RepID=UPI000972E5C3|nr:hypothetical protein [Winogradskyella sp. J14-2]APY07309.1 hypothetical protein BWZ20_02875 [Winogradskyella sp. J14-2]
MKNLLKSTLLACTALLLFTCTADPSENDLSDDLTSNQLNDPCVAQNPITRVINNGTVAVDFKVIDTDGVVLVDIPNIPANTTTSWASFQEGDVLFSIDSNATLVSDDKIILTMESCMAYEIEINNNNEIISYLPTFL